MKLCQVNPSEVTTAFGNQKDKTTKSFIIILLKEIAHSIISAIEMDNRGFINEMNIWATNPFGLDFLDLLITNHSKFLS